MSKRVFEGTMEEYLNLPGPYRDEFSPPVQYTPKSSTTTTSTVTQPKSPEPEITSQTIQYLALQDYGKQTEKIRSTNIEQPIQEVPKNRLIESPKTPKETVIWSRLPDTTIYSRTPKGVKVEQIIKNFAVESYTPETKQEKTEDVVLGDAKPDLSFGWRSKAEQNLIKEYGPSTSITESILNLSGKAPGFVATRVNDITRIPMRSKTLDFVAGAVGSVESIVNPNVPVASVSLLEGKLGETTEKYGLSYVVGSFIGEAAFLKGLGSAGKAVGISGKTLIAGGALNVGIGQGISYAVSGQPLTIKESRNAAIIGATETVTGGYALKFLATQGGVVGQKIVGNYFGRMAIGAGIDATSEAITSGGDPEAIARGVAFGAVSNVVFDAGGIVVGKTRSKLPSGFGGKTTLVEGEMTTGRQTTSEVKTFETKNNLENFDKPLRVVPDTSSEVVGSVEAGKTVTTKTILKEYVDAGEIVGLHGTTTPDAFDLKTGGKTVIKEFPSEAGAARQKIEHYPLYFAPEHSGKITGYGGYAGLSDFNYEEGAKFSIGGKSTFIAVEAEIPKYTLPKSNESIEDFVIRSKTYKGVMEVDPLTAKGASIERQLSTPTGGVLISKGKVGSYQIKSVKEVTIPLINKKIGIPQYRSFDVYSAELKAPTVKEITEIETKPPKIIDETYISSSSQKTKIVTPSTKVSLPKNVFSSKNTVISQSSSLTSISKVSSTVSSLPSISSKSINSIIASSPKTINYPSLPSVKSYPSFPDSFPSKPSPDSYPDDFPSFPDSFPSKPSPKSYPSYPDSFPSKPSPKSYPSFPKPDSFPSSPKPTLLLIGTEVSKKKKGKEFLKKIQHPVLTPGQVKSQLVFGDGGKKNKSLII